jgi:hypothetical protein
VGVVPFIVALSIVIQEPAHGQAPEPQVTRRVQSDRTRDVRLEKAIVKNLADALPDDRLRFEYYYNRVDLDGDYKPVHYERAGTTGAAHFIRAVSYPRFAGLMFDNLFCFF